MKVAHNLSPSRNKQQKANLFANDNPEELEVIRISARHTDADKVMLRLDQRTHVLVHPRNATPEYAEKLRRRYKINYPKGAEKKTR